MEAVFAFDSTRLTRLLTRDWAWLGPQVFLSDRIAPLLSAVGEAWSEGRLEIRHEHFISEKVTDILRTFRLPFEEAAGGPLVILATLPGEQHDLGLQMCSLILAVAGCRVLNLGVEVPVAEIANLVAETGARAVGLSISPATAGAPTRQQIEELRRLLPPHVQLLAGGKGAPPDLGPGIEVMGELSTVNGWARQMSAQAGRDGDR
jgi:methanogenic corrinoid protein MtbC1